MLLKEKALNGISGLRPDLFTLSSRTPQLKVKELGCDDSNLPAGLSHFTIQRGFPTEPFPLPTFTLKTHPFIKL